MTTPDSNDHELAADLAAERPAPSREFSDGLRARLLELDARERRPPHLWVLVSIYASSGTVLLVLAAIASLRGGL